METGILILLLIVSLILILSIYQQQMFWRMKETLRDTEQTFRNAKKAFEWAEKNFQNRLSVKDKEVASLQQTFQRTEERINQLFEYLREHTVKSPFNYQSEWWQDYSWLYRHVKDWECEECSLSLDLDRRYLHTHHLYGTLCNDPKDLKALCIACHSEQPGINHQKITKRDDYGEFMKKYGDEWRLRKAIA